MINHSKRGGVWGVRWFAVCTICQRMAKSAAIICSVLLPLASFGGFDPAFVEYADNPTNILMFKAYVYNSNLATLSPNYVYGNKDTLPSIVISTVKIGVEVRPLSNVILYHPQGDNEVFPSVSSIDYPITRAYDQSRWYCLEYTPDIYHAVNICASLIRSGYRSPRMEIFKDQPNNTVICNFRIGDIFSDVLTGTNSFFRSQLLSQLSNVNGSLQTLALSLGTVSSDYKTVNNLYLNPSKDTLLDSAANSVTLNGDSGGSQNLTRLFSGDYAGRESEITKALSDLARSQLQSVWLSTLDSESPFFGNNINDILNDPAKFQQAVSHGGGGSSLANIMRDVKRLTTNDWASAVTNQLANNTASITNQLEHMFDEGTAMGSSLANLQDRSLQIADNTSSIDSRLANGITVAVVNQGGTSVGVHLDGPITVEQSQFNSLGVPLSSLENIVSDWYSDWYSFFSVSSPVYKWENFYNMVSSFKDQVHQDFSSLGSISNLLAAIDDRLKDLFPTLTNNNNIAFDSFSALLLDNYQDYVSNGYYAASLDSFREKCPSVYSNLVDLGLSPSGNGDFWSLFGSSLLYQSELVGNVIDDLNTVREFADNHIEGGFSAGIRSIVDKFPSKTEIQDYVNTASNVISDVNSKRLAFISSFDSATNATFSAFSPFAGTFESVPDQLVFFKTGNDQYITIPVGEQATAWQIIRYGISFCLAAVNLLLLPKFLLLVVRLFSPLGKSIIKVDPIP